MTTTQTTVHYDYNGSDFYGITSTGFCGAQAGLFTIALDEVTCTECCDVVAGLRG